MHPDSGGPLETITHGPCPASAPDPRSAGSAMVTENLAPDSGVEASHVGSSGPAGSSTSATGLAALPAMKERQRLASPFRSSSTQVSDPHPFELQASAQDAPSGTEVATPLPGPASSPGASTEPSLGSTLPPGAGPYLSTLPVAAPSPGGVMPGMLGLRRPGRVAKYVFPFFLVWAHVCSATRGFLCPFFLQAIG